MPPAGTLFDRFTVQVLLAFEPMVEGLQATELTVTDTTRLMLDLADEPL
jgi:hypothetical protein